MSLRHAFTGSPPRMGSKLFFFDVKSYIFSTYLFFFSTKERFRAKKRFLHDHHVCLKSCTGGGVTRSAIAPSPPLRGNACILRSKTPPPNRNRFLFLTQLVAVAGGVLIFGGGPYCV